MFNRKIGTISKKIHTPYEGMFGGGGTHTYIKEVTGNGYINLTNAVANKLLELKAYGGTEQRNLPSGYTQQQYIYMQEGSYIKVEDLPISAGYKIEYDFQTTTLSTNLRNYLGGRANGVSAGGGFRLSKLANSNNNRVVLYGFETGTEYYDPTSAFQANTRYKYTYNNGVCTLESGGSVVSTRTFTVNDDTSTNWGINCYGNGTSWQTSTDGIYVYSLKVWNEQDELVMDLVPAVQRGTVPVVCFYDTVTDTIRTATDGTFMAGPEAVPTPSNPIDIVCNNGAIKYGKLITFDSTRYYAYISQIGNWAYSTDSYSIVVPVTVGKKYKVTVPSDNPLNNAQNIIFRYGFTDTINEDWKNDNLTSQSTITMYDWVRTTPQDLSSVEITATHPYLIIQMGQAAFSYILDNNLITITDQTIYTDGTVETILSHGKNLFNAATRITGYYISAEGVVTENVDSYYSALIPVQPNTYYTYSGRAYGGNKRLHAYDASGNWIQQINYASVPSSSQQADFSTLGQTPANCKYVRISGASADTNVQLELGSTATTYEAYYNGGTATTKMLLKVGDYQDVQSIIDGAVTRKVGIKVLDGTETGWTKLSGVNYVSLPKTAISNMASGTDATCLSNSFAQVAHSSISLSEECFSVGASYVNFKKTGDPTAAQFKQWLANQYAAGTPVIVIYPLATPTTETVTGQSMDIQAGTNTIEITQASIDNLPLYAKYNSTSA